MRYTRPIALLASIVIIASCSESANPTRPSSAPASVVEWTAIAAGGRNTTAAIASADAPAPPSNLTSMLSGSTLTLTWTASPGAASYVVEAGTGAGLTNITSFNTGSSATTLTVPGVPAGSYYVRVRARNAEGTSSPSNELIVIVGGPTCDTAPNAPTNLTSSVDGNMLTLTWSAPVGGCPVESYIISAGTTEGATNLADFDTRTTSTTFFADVGGVLDIGDVFGRTIAAAGIGEFYVHVSSRNARGRSPKSPATRVRRTTPPPPPPPPPPHGCSSKEQGEAYDTCTGYKYPVTGPRAPCLAECQSYVNIWFNGGKGCEPYPFQFSCSR